MSADVEPKKILSIGETIEKRRAELVAQRDQLMANFNASMGAIAMCDELLKLEKENAEKRASVAAD